MGRALAFLLAAGILGAQTAPIASQEILRAKQLLASPATEDRAWGAYLAARLHSPQLDSLLLDQLQSVAAGDHDLVAVLLDAAIEADLTVPSATLEPLKDYWTDAVMILLARGKDSEDVLMQLRTNQPRDVVWLAANNLLLGRKSQAWFAAMLGEIKISHRFLVIDGMPRPGAESGMGGGVCGDGVLSMPAGFPPVSVYELDDTPHPANVLLAPGPRNVYFRKKLVPSGRQVGLGSCSSTIDRPALDIDYLAELAGQPADQSQQLFHGSTRIVFSSVADLQRQIEPALEAQQTSVRDLIQTIARKNELRIPDVQLSIVPEIVDARGDTAEPLPRPAARQFDLR